MKAELIEQFGVRESDGYRNPVRDQRLDSSIGPTRAEARRRLGIEDSAPTMLFFGNIAPYKGLAFLVAAYQRIALRHPDYRRRDIARRLTRGCEQYMNDVQRAIETDASQPRIVQRIDFIPDDEAETYFKAADVLVLPYTHVYQSGVLISGYTFGLPAVASDVGSFKDDIVEGETGLVKPCDPIDLARVIEEYFESDLFAALESTERRFASTREDDIRGPR